MKSTSLVLFLIVQSLVVFYSTAPIDSAELTAFADRINQNSGIVSRSSRGIVLVDFSGEGGYEVFPSTEWTFFGPVRSVSVVDGQKLVATGTAVLGTNAGVSKAAIAVCYQNTAGGPILPVVGDNHLNVDIDAAARPIAVTGSVEPAAGKYSVGICLVNRGPEVIGNNNYVNGWAIVTD